jgi:CheY-like chemotaxis protein
LSKTITSVLGQQQHEIIEISGRKLLLIFGEAVGTSFVIIPGWYIGNEKYEDDKLTAVDVELIDDLDRMNIEQMVRQYLEKRGSRNTRISFWGASGFSEEIDLNPNTKGAGKGKVLVVDDDPGIREIVRVYLEREGYSVQTASSTSEAAMLLKTMADSPPNLMLLDIMMPGATGWQLLRDLESDPKLGKIPVVAISGLEKPNAGDQYDSKMLYDYLVKPFSMEELSRVIRKFARPS